MSSISPVPPEAPLYQQLYAKYLSSPQWLKDLSATDPMEIAKNPALAKFCDKNSWDIKIKTTYSSVQGEGRGSR